MASRTSPTRRRETSSFVQALTALFSPQERETAEPARAPSAAELQAERRRYATQCMLLGLEACRRCDARRAFDTFHEAFVAFQQTGDRRAASLMQKAVGLVAQKIETPAKVRAAFIQARSLLQQAGLRDEEARTLFLLADFEGQQAAFGEAYALYEDSLRLCRSIDYVVGEVECLCRYGWTLKEHGRLDDAKRRILEARKTAQERGDEALIARVTKWVQKFRETEAAPAAKGAKGKTIAAAAPAGGARTPWQPIQGAQQRPRPPMSQPARSRPATRASATRRMAPSRA